MLILIINKNYSGEIWDVSLLEETRGSSEEARPRADLRYPPGAHHELGGSRGLDPAGLYQTICSKVEFRRSFPVSDSELTRRGLEP